jgi:hypothetical protein
MTHGRATSQPRSERAQEREAGDLAGSWLEARVLYAQYTSSLESAGLLKVQTHCPRAEGLTPRSFHHCE